MFAENESGLPIEFSPITLKGVELHIERMRFGEVQIERLRNEVNAFNDMQIQILESSKLTLRAHKPAEKAEDAQFEICRDIEPVKDKSPTLFPKEAILSALRRIVADNGDYSDASDALEKLKFGQPLIIDFSGPNR